MTALIIIHSQKQESTYGALGLSRNICIFMVDWDINPEDAK
jgi:hypothetical protein